jgi:hypothetical protein
MERTDLLPIAGMLAEEVGNACRPAFGDCLQALEILGVLSVVGWQQIDDHPCQFTANTFFRQPVPGPGAFLVPHQHPGFDQQLQMP